MRKKITDTVVIKNKVWRIVTVEKNHWIKLVNKWEATFYNEITKEEVAKAKEPEGTPKKVTKRV